MGMHFPNESQEYRAARDRLLEKEIELQAADGGGGRGAAQAAAGRHAQGGLYLRRAWRDGKPAQYPLLRTVRAWSRHA